MNLPASPSPEKRKLVHDVVSDLAGIDGVIAVVLGGSHAEGGATEASYVDLGIYYSEKSPFDIAAIQKVADKFAVQPTKVTGLYGWGPWANGGAWIATAQGPVDFVYRNLEQVDRTIEDAAHGRWSNDFDQQPPYGFSSVFYLAETRSCVALHDPSGHIARLKSLVATYPAQLKATIVGQTLWAAEFTIWQAEQFCQKGDVYNAVGCFTRAAKSLVMALYALNETFPMGDKRSMSALASMTIKPHDVAVRIESFLSTDRSKLASSLDTLRELHQETVALAGPLYRSMFTLKS